MVDGREKDLLRQLWAQGPLSRWELHERTGLHPNAVGTAIGALVEGGLLREGAAAKSAGGRPRVPLEIDPGTRHVVGLSIAPGRVEAGRLNLRGELLGEPIARDVADPRRIISSAAAALRRVVSGQTLSVGVSVTGFIDPEARTVLFSSALPGLGNVSLAPLFKAATADDVAAESRPVVVENDMHALAARWLLTHRSESNQDVLMVSIGDGRLGAAMLIDGRPNRGCAIAGNELGHARFFVETDRCFCGHVGCLEQICSTAFLNRRDAASGRRATPATLMERAARFAGPIPSKPNDRLGKPAQKLTHGNGLNGHGRSDGVDAGLIDLTQYLSMGIANAANLVRPDRLVLVSELTRYDGFHALLEGSIRSALLNVLADRVQIDAWDQPLSQACESAAWLALANLYIEGWDHTRTTNR